MDWSAILDRVLSRTDYVPRGYRTVGPVRTEQVAPNQMVFNEGSGIVMVPEPSATHIPTYDDTLRRYYQSDLRTIKG